ncbi:hypothetical protein IWQ61_002211 [Dispira simplex]|nr:hypothetical protein IWQ61_002211 [Dispira simplex]
MFSNNNNNPPFGSGSTFGSSAFGQPSAPAGGSTFNTSGNTGSAFGGGGSAFGAQPSTTTSPWGGGNAFGSAPSTTPGTNTGTTTGGAWNQPSGGFTGASTTGSAFNTGGGAFGSSAAARPGFGSTGTGFGASTALGAGTPSGGTTGTTGFNAFGSSTTGSTAFGSSANQGTSNAFSQPAAGSAFGSAAGSAFGGGTAATGTPNNGTAGTRYTTTAERNPTTGVTEYLQTITAMPAYQSQSVEELRVQDYLQGRKQPMQGQAFGQGATPVSGAGSTFGTGASAFGSTAPATTSTAFGANPPAGGFGSTTGSGFGTTAGGFNTSGPGFSGGSGFGGGAGTFGSTPAASAAPSGTAFGATTTGSTGPSFGGAFGATNTSQPSAFGTGTGFGATTSQPAASGPATTSAFGAFGATAPANQGTGTTTSAFGGSGFGTTTGFNTGATAATSTPATGFSAFGSTGTSTFGNTATSNPPFGAASGTTSTAPTGGSLFGTAQPSTGFGAFGQQSGTSTTGATGGGLFGAPAATSTTTTRPFGSTPATGTGLFGSTSTATTSAAGGGTSLFGGNATLGGSGVGGGGLFGSTATPGTTGGGLFGTGATSGITNTAAGTTGTAPSFGAGPSGLLGTPQQQAGGVLRAGVDQSPYGINPLLTSTTTTTTTSGSNLRATPIRDATTAGTQGAATPGSAAKKLPLTPMLRMTPRSSSRLKLRGFAAPSPLSVTGSPFQSSTSSAVPSPISRSRTAALDDLSGSFSPDMFVPRHSAKKLAIRKSLGPGVVPVTPSGLTSLTSHDSHTDSPMGQAARNRALRHTNASSPLGARTLSSSFMGTPLRSSGSPRMTSTQTTRTQSRTLETPRTPRVSFDPNLESAANGMSGSSFLASLTGSTTGARTPQSNGSGALDPNRSFLTAEQTQADRHTNGTDECTNNGATPDVPAYEEDGDLPATTAVNTPYEPAYWTKPSLDELQQMDQEALKAVNSFKCGMAGVGQVTFLNPVDLTLVDSVADIPGRIILFDHQRCTVYPDESCKPPRGQGLNVPAVIALEGCWPIEKATRQPITDRSHPKMNRQIAKLKKVPETTFIDFVPETGVWTFRVEHFSRYGLDPDDDSDHEMIDQSETSNLRQFPPGSMRGVNKSAITKTPLPTHGTRRQLTIAQPNHPSQTSPLAAPQFTAQSSSAFLGNSQHSNAWNSSLRGQPTGPSTDDSDSSVFSPNAPAYLSDVSLSPDPYARYITDLSYVYKDKADHEYVAFEEKSKADADAAGLFPLSSTRSMLINPLKRERKESPHLSTGNARTTDGGMQSSLATNPSDAFLSGRLDPAKSSHFRGFGAKPSITVTANAHNSNAMLLKVHSPQNSGMSNASDEQAFIFKRIKFSDSLIHGRTHLVADAGLMLGRSFRVGWGPGGLIAVGGMDLTRTTTDISPSSSMSHVSIRPLTMWPTGQHASRQDLITSHSSLLSTHLSHTTVVLDTHGVPRASLRSSLRFADLVHQVQNHASAIQVVNPEETLLWKLCSALWDPLPDILADIQQQRTIPERTVEHVEYLQRRAQLSRWLQEAVGPAMHQDVREAVTQQDWAQAIFHLMVGHRLTAATELASRSRDHRLATLLAQLGEENKMLQEDLNTQLTEWQDSNAVGLVQATYRKIYTLLAGRVDNPVETNAAGNHATGDSASVLVCKGLDWKRALAAYVWYSDFNDEVGELQRLPRILNQFEKASLDTSHSAVACPRPWYISDSLIADQLYSLTFQTARHTYSTLFHILKLYNHDTYRLEQALGPLGYSTSLFDYRVSWILFQVLARVYHVRNFMDGSTQASQVVSAQADQLCATFAFQLEYLGLWHWAIYVLLFLPDSTARQTSIMGVLERQLPSTGDASRESVVEMGGEYQFTPEEHFLVNTLRIPPAWIHQARAVYCLYRGWTAQETHHCLLAGEYTRAHRIAVTFLAPQAILDERYTFLRDLFKRMESRDIPQWSTGGQLYLEYTDVVGTFEQLQHKLTPEMLSNKDDSELDEATESQLYELRSRAQAVLRLLPNLLPPTPSAVLSSHQVRLRALGQVSKNISTDHRVGLAVTFKVSRSEMAVRITALIQCIDKYLVHRGGFQSNVSVDNMSITSHSTQALPGFLVSSTAWSRLPIPEDQRLSRLNKLSHEYFQSVVHGLKG